MNVAHRDQPDDEPTHTPSIAQTSPSTLASGARSRLRLRLQLRASQRGFTLIELMTVVAIFGIMATLAIAGYTKNVRNARRTEVIGDLSNISLRQNALMSARGHYASTGATENDTYPVGAQRARSQDRRDAVVRSTDEGYTRDAVAVGTPYFRAGGVEHGFDALSFIPEGGQSLCATGSSRATAPTASSVTSRPVFPLAAEVFPAAVPARALLRPRLVLHLRKVRLRPRRRILGIHDGSFLDGRVDGRQELR